MFTRQNFRGVSVRLASVVVGMLGLTSGLSTASADEEARYTSPRYGYSVAIPEGWEQSPDEVVRQMGEAVAPGANGPIYETAFQPRLGQGSKLVGVQVLPYSKFGVTGPLSDADIQEFIKSISGVDINTLVKDSLKPEYSTLVNGGKVTSTHWDSAKRRFTWSMEMSLAGGTNLRVSSAVYFGRDAAVQVVFSSLAEEWNQNWTVCGHLFESFRFENVQAVSDTHRLDLVRPNAFNVP